MIFVTVGTHEQQFNRLIKEVDRLAGEGIIRDEIMIQTGFSTFEPRYCNWAKLISFSEMQNNIKNARIIITHGGPASFIAPLQIGKIPIVVPRQKRYGEHINNHQLEFCSAVKEKYNNIILVEQVEELSLAITNYEENLMQLTNEGLKNNIQFNEDFKKIVEKLMIK